MRTKKEFIKISVTKELYDRIIKERGEFQETIGGGKWSISDTIWQWLKIANYSRK